MKHLSALEKIINQKRIVILLILMHLGENIIFF